MSCSDFFFQAEDGIRYLVRSRGLGDVYKRQAYSLAARAAGLRSHLFSPLYSRNFAKPMTTPSTPCLLYTSDAADERSSVDLGGRRIIKKKKSKDTLIRLTDNKNNQRRAI